MMTFSRYTFDFAFRILLVLLPFMTVLSIFTKEKLGIPGFSFVKELLLLSMLFTVLFVHVRGQKKIVWTQYDIWVGSYIAILIVISFFTTGLSGIIYG
jgi:heme/copper-type cytochrome/quinol oxidase subunit 4